MSGTWVSEDLDDSARPTPTPEALLAVTYISLLGWFYHLYATLLGRYLTALTSPTYWDLQYNSGLTQFEIYLVCWSLAYSLTSTILRRKKIRLPLKIISRTFVSLIFLLILNEFEYCLCGSVKCFTDCLHFFVVVHVYSCKCLCMNMYHVVLTEVRRLLRTQFSPFIMRLSGTELSLSCLEACTFKCWAILLARDASLLVFVPDIWCIE